jgi:hypothetical protein
MSEKNTSQNSLKQVNAILNWGWEEQSTIWNVETEKPVKVQVRVCMRCPEAVAGSRYVIRAAGQKLDAQVQGSGPMQERIVYPNTSKGYSHLPFVWKEVGVINLPAGRTQIEMQPTWINWGGIFMDVMGLELITL